MRIHFDEHILRKIEGMVMGMVISSLTVTDPGSINLFWVRIHFDEHILRKIEGMVMGMVISSLTVTEQVVSSSPGSK